MSRTLREERGILIPRPCCRPEATSRDPAAPPRRHRRPHRRAARARPRARRRHGHDDPGPRPGGGRLPRASGSPTTPATSRATTTCSSLTQPEIIRGDPPRLPRGRRRPARDEHVQRAAHLARRLRHAGPRLRDERRRGLARARRVRRDDRAHARPARAGCWARSARPTARHPSPPTSTTPAPATSPTTSSSRPTSSRPAASSTAAPTCCSSRRSSTPSTPRPPIFALETLFEEHERRWPVMISGTITDASGRTLSGQVTEAFWYSVRHARPLAVGLNCALGAGELRPYVAELARIADCFVSALPERRSAQRVRRVRRDPRGDGARRGRVRRPPGWSTSSAAAAARHPTHIAAIAKAPTGGSPARADRRAAGPAAVGPRAVRHRRGQPLRQRRRAHQHHRLGPLPPADHRGGLRRPPSTSPASRSRRARRSSTSTWTRG